MNVTIVGASKVGRCLARELRARGHHVALHSRRGPLPSATIATPLLIVATRDTEVRKLATELARARKVSARTAVVHMGGGIGPEELAPLGDVAAGLAQAHPLLSFASAEHPPAWRGALMLVRGDRIAVARARVLARSLGMVPRSWAVDPSLYHAAAGLLANGAAALAALAADLLHEAGAPRRDVPRSLGPLLRSVANNVERLGVRKALTGPVRRGDVAMVKRHVEAVERASPDALAAYVALGRAQLPLARALGDASARDLLRLERLFDDRSAPRARRRRR